MILRLDHPDISSNEKTYLSSTCSAGATTLTVQNIEGFSTSEYLVLGKLGEEKTELVQVHTSTSPSGSTITLNAATSFSHAVNTPVTFIKFNQIAVYSASSKTGSYSAVSGSPKTIEVDQEFTEFEDSVGTTTTWYKIRYYNSTSATYASYSDPVKGEGYTENSLRKLIDKANALANDKQNKILKEDDKIDIINEGYQYAINRLEKADHKRFIKKGYVDVKNSYDTGSVAVSNNSTAVTGTDTVWSTSWTGKKIIFGDEGFPYEISSVDSETGLTLTRAYIGDGTALSGSTYIIYQDEYDIYDESTGSEVVDFKKIEQVSDEDNNIVNEYDLHRTETGYYLKRNGEDLKFCLNYVPSDSGDEGRWTVQYRYQPLKLDSMADEPEFPSGYSGILVSYLCSKIRERAGDMNKATYYMGEFEARLGKMIRECVPRTNEKRGFRLDRNLRSHYEHDSDWRDDIFSRRTIGS